MDKHIIPPRRKTDEGGPAVPTGPVIDVWVAGSNTVTPVPIAAGRAKCQRLGIDNPRISKQVSNLNVGKTYRMDTNHYVGTAIGNAYYRVSDTSGLWTPTYGEHVRSITSTATITFVAPAGGLVFIGLVQIASTDDMYAETADTFTLTQTN